MQKYLNSKAENINAQNYICHWSKFSLSEKSQMDVNIMIMR